MAWPFRTWYRNTRTIELVHSGSKFSERMKCLCCGEKIGFLRRLAGSRFCCPDHRDRYRRQSARALRDVEDLTGEDDWSSNAVWRGARLSDHRAQPPQDSKATVFGFMAAAFLVIAVVAGAGRGGGEAAPPRPATYSVPMPSPAQLPAISRFFHSGGSTVLHDNFRSGMSGWLSAHSGRGWSFADGYVKPGGLRLWGQSTSMADYEFEFVGQIQRRSMSWAFRAPDVANYYASKLIINGTSSEPTAGLVRFVVVGGRECERVELPLPIALERGTDYHVSLTVRGSRFLTSVNGQLVSSWSDSRITRGGVGFFSEDGDVAAVKWASLTEHDGFISRLASYFSLIAFPADPLE